MTMEYVDITVESEDSKDVLARLVHAVHKYNAPRRMAMGDGGTHPLAFSLPNFSEAAFDESARCVAFPQAGFVLRIFGEHAALAEYMQTPGVSRMSKMGMVFLAAPASIPDRAGSERFSRDRKLQKAYRDNAYARRQKSRAESQGRAHAARKHGVVEPAVRFEMSSGSQGQKFLLDVRRGASSPNDAWFLRINAYGLCAENTAIPKF